MLVLMVETTTIRLRAFSRWSTTGMTSGRDEIGKKVSSDPVTHINFSSAEFDKSARRTLAKLPDRRYTSAKMPSMTTAIPQRFRRPPPSQHLQTSMGQPLRHYVPKGWASPMTPSARRDGFGFGCDISDISRPTSEGAPRDGDWFQTRPDRSRCGRYPALRCRSELALCSVVRMCSVIRERGDGWRLHSLAFFFHREILIGFMRHRSGQFA